MGEGAGQVAVEDGSLGGAAVVQSAGVGFVVCSARYVQWKCSLPGRNSCIGIGFAACTESEHEGTGLNILSSKESDSVADN